MEISAQAPERFMPIRSDQRVPWSTAVGRSLEVAYPPFIDQPIAIIVILVTDLELRVRRKVNAETPQSVQTRRLRAEIHGTSEAHGRACPTHR